MLKLLFELKRRAGYESVNWTIQWFWLFYYLQDRKWCNEFDWDITLSAFKCGSLAFVETIQQWNDAQKFLASKAVSVYLSVYIDFSMIMNPCELYYPPATSSPFIIRVVKQWRGWGRAKYGLTWDKYSDLSATVPGRNQVPRTHKHTLALIPSRLPAVSSEGRPERDHANICSSVRPSEAECMALSSDAS